MSVYVYSVDMCHNLFIYFVFCAQSGPHPGMRAAAEMKKQAATTQGSGKGMMSVVLPMYAVGIVLYLIYTLSKVQANY